MKLVHSFNLVYNSETNEKFMHSDISKLASTLLIIESAYLERNNNNEHHRIGLLSLLQNTSLRVFCSHDLYPSTYAENRSERWKFKETYFPSILKKIFNCKVHILVWVVTLSPFWMPPKPTKPPSEVVWMVWQTGFSFSTNKWKTGSGFKLV